VFADILAGDVIDHDIGQGGDGSLIMFMIVIPSFICLNTWQKQCQNENI
jgi:hypothetical protein